MMLIFFFQPGPVVSDDTIGLLISSQMSMALPGIDHLAHGFDIFSGTEFAAPIFRFTYCNTSDSHVLQDAYRWVSYQLPYQVNTGMKSLKKKEKKYICIITIAD